MECALSRRAPSPRASEGSIADSVRARIASAWLGSASARTRLGSFVLRSSQERTLARVRDAIAEFGGALLADPPGTGKTVVALAACGPGEEALVVAPAALRTHWRRAALRAATAIRFVSIESLSRGATPSAARFVIVDEAHHVRTPNTRRHRALTALCADAPVLLLSATPVVNRKTDRDTLLGLFLGARAARLQPEELGRCVVRGHVDAASRPAVSRLEPLRGAASVPGLASALVRLPPPFALSSGSPATPLIIMSLALAWRSSLAALDAMLRRRQQRGEALADILQEGIWPSPSALRRWVTDAEVTQLAWPTLVTALEPAVPAARVAEAARSLRAHLDAVGEIRALIRPRVAADTRARADAIRALAAAYPTDRLVIFAQHADTVRALHGVLRRDAGVVTITGARVTSAAGRWSRDEVLSVIGPRARPFRRDDPRMIRIVLATDLLAEGVEMQGVRIVVHADLPWTPARLEQRLGRVTRLGSTAPDVGETWFAAPPGVSACLRLAARLAGKARVRHRAMRDSTALGRIEEIMLRWHASSSPGPARIACVEGDGDGFVAVVRTERAVRLVCAFKQRGRWRVSAAPRWCVRVLSRASGAVAPDDPCAVTRAKRLLSQAMRVRAAQELAGIGSATIGGIAARCLARLDRVLRTSPVLQRAAIADRHRRVRDALGRHLPVGLERRITALLREEHDDSRFLQALDTLLTVRGREPTPEERVWSHRSGERIPSPRLVALLLVRPAVRSTPAAAVPSAP